MRKLLTTYEAAEFLGVSTNTLMQWRAAGAGPGFVKGPGRRKKGIVRYDPDTLERWAANGGELHLTRGERELAACGEGEGSSL